jgi:hypothetical protein
MGLDEEAVTNILVTVLTQAMQEEFRGFSYVQDIGI